MPGRSIGTTVGRGIMGGNLEWGGGGFGVAYADDAVQTGCCASSPCSCWARACLFEVGGYGFEVGEVVA